MVIAVAALALNAVLCAFFSSSIDVFLIANALILAAAVVRL